MSGAPCVGKLLRSVKNVCEINPVTGFGYRFNFNPFP